MPKVKKQFYKSFILMAFIPMLLASLGYLWGATLVTRLTNESFSDKLNQTMREVDRSLDSVEKLSQTLANTTWVKRVGFMQGDQIDYGQVNRYDFSQYALEIKNYASMNPLVDSIAIVFNKKNVIVSAEGIDDYNWFFTHAYNMENMTTQNWTEVLNRGEDVILYPQWVTHYGATTRYVTYIKTVRLTKLNFTITPSNYKEQFGMVTLIIMMPEKNIASLLRTITEGQETAAYILDENGIPITSVRGRPEVLQQIEALPPSTQPHTFRMEDGTQMVAFSAVSQKNGWRYLAVQPSKAMLSQIWLMKYLTAIFIILFLTAVVAFLLVMVVSRRTYAPINRILQTIDTQTGASHTSLKQKSEFEYISQMLGDYFRNNHDLKHLTQLYTPLVIHSLFVKLLYNFANKEDREILEKIDEISSPQTPWVAIVALLDEKDAPSLFRQQIQRRQVNDHVVAFALLAERHKMVIITNAKTRKEMQETVDLILEDTIYLPLQQTHIGAGRHSSTLWEISSSYYDANKALNFQPLGKSRFAISFFQDTDKGKSRGEAEFFYKEADVVAFVHSNQPLQVVQMLDELAVRVGVTSESALLSVQCLYYNLLSTAFRLSGEIGFGLQEVVHEYDLAQTHSVRTMKHNIARIYDILCIKIAEHKQKGKGQALEEIVQYIQTHCSNEALTLQSLSAQFQLSVPYLSKMIKQYTGENFVDYLGRLRIKKAKQLLQETHGTVEQIGQEVGYGNPLTFRRAFKKYEGVTPGMYRTSLGFANEDE